MGNDFVLKSALIAREGLGKEVIEELSKPDAREQNPGELVFYRHRLKEAFAYMSLRQMLPQTQEMFTVLISGVVSQRYGTNAQEDAEVERRNPEQRVKY